MRIITVLILFMLFSCNSGPEKRTEIFKDSEKHAVGFLQREVYLPSNYEKVNLSELEEMIRQNPDINQIDRANYEAASRYNSGGLAPVFFKDKLDKSNCIWFIPGPYFEISKEMLPIFQQSVQQSQGYASQTHGMTFDNTSSSLLTLQNTKVLKSKSEHVLGGERRFVSRYIVTYQSKSFILIIANNQDVDYEYILQNFSSYI